MGSLTEGGIVCMLAAGRERGDADFGAEPSPHVTFGDALEPTLWEPEGPIEWSSGWPLGEGLAKRTAAVAEAREGEAREAMGRGP